MSKTIHCLALASLVISCTSIYADVAKPRGAWATELAKQTIVERVRTTQNVPLYNAVMRLASYAASPAFSDEVIYQVPSYEIASIEEFLNSMAAPNNAQVSKKRGQMTVTIPHGQLFDALIELAAGETRRPRR